MHESATRVDTLHWEARSNMHAVASNAAMPNARRGTLSPPDAVLVKYLKVTAKIDALNVLRPTAPALPGRGALQAYGDRGFPIPDPTHHEIRLFLEADPVCHVEFAVDFHPKGKLRTALLSTHAHKHLPILKKIFRLLAQYIYPCGAPGIAIESARVSWRKNAWVDVAEDKPFDFGTFYLGNRDGEPQLKIYVKTRDQSKDLPPSKQFVRIELTLADRKACEDWGLKTAGDLLKPGLDKKLAPYFRFARPRPRTLAQVRKLGHGPDLRKPAVRRRTEFVARSFAALIESSFRGAGARGVTGFGPWADTGKRVSVEQLNRPVLAALRRRFAGKGNGHP